MKTEYLLLTVVNWIWWYTEYSCLVFTAPADSNHMPMTFLAFINCINPPVIWIVDAPSTPFRLTVNLSSLTLQINRPSLFECDSDIAVTLLYCKNSSGTQAVESSTQGALWRCFSREWMLVFWKQNKTKKNASIGCQEVGAAGFTQHAVLLLTLSAERSAAAGLPRLQPSDCTTTVNKIHSPNSCTLLIKVK